jgi:hypothetical protein
MTHRKALYLISLAAIAGATAPCYAQQATAPGSQSAAPAAASPTTPTTATLSSAAPAPAAPASADSAAGPSPELLKKARQEGFKPKTVNGVTQFCYRDASTGTHFQTEKCYDEAHLMSVLAQRQDQRNSLSKPNTCEGAGCGSH